MSIRTYDGRAHWLEAAVLIGALVIAGCLGDSQVTQNITPQEEFHRILRRDLQSYFYGARVDYELLRDEPTQSGVAYPKYYVWIRVTSADGVRQGAARVAAADGERFEVTHFISAHDIRADPDGVERVFPAALCAEIRRRAQSHGA